MPLQFGAGLVLVIALASHPHVARRAATHTHAGTKAGPHAAASPGSEPAQVAAPAAESANPSTPSQVPAPARPAIPPWLLDRRTLAGGVGALMLLVLLRGLRRRARRPELRVEVVLEPGHEGRFRTVLLPADGEPVAEAMLAALQAGPAELLDPGFAHAPGALRKLAARAMPVRHVTSLGKLAPGAYRVLTFGRSAPQRELQLRVGGATASRSAEQIRSHAQERRVQLLGQALTLPFDFRVSRPRANSGAQQARPASLGGAALPLPADPGTSAPIQDTRTAELYRRAREAFLAGQYELAAELYHQVGDAEQEARCYLFAGKPEQVARLDAQQAEARGEKALAVNHYLRAKDHAAAARLLRELGREKEALHLQAQGLLEGGSRDAARALFEQAGDLARAAELLELDGKLDAAVDAYERANAWEAAARLAARSGNAPRAAADFERAKRPAEAAVLRLKLGEAAAAMQLALAVAPGEPGELLAVTVLARLYQAEGRETDLRALTSRACEAPLPAASDRDALRALAAFYEQLALREPARALYSRLAETDPTDLDAADHAGALVDAAPVAAVAGRASETLAALDTRATTGAVPRELLRSIQAKPPRAAETPPAAQSSSYAPAAASTVIPITASSAARPAAPRGNDRYRLEAELGRGAMGVVYRATDQLLGRPVAIKTLPPELAAAEQLRRLFLDEARALAALNHPHVVQVYDLGEMEGSLFLAMELLEGESLETVLDRAPRLPLAQVARILDELAQALEAAHGRGIVHRDVKPANVMVAADGALKLMDFGIAAGGAVSAPMQVGTPRYMSPEQIRGEEVDARADLYALGVLAYRLCTGEMPFPDENVFQHHLTSPAPSIRARRPELPEGLELLVGRLLAKRREERPASAAEVRSALAQLFPRAA